MESINISQSVDPNTLVVDVHHAHKMRFTLLISRAEAEALCDKLRTLLGDIPAAVISSDKVALFPNPKEQEMQVGIVPSPSTK